MSEEDDDLLGPEPEPELPDNWDEPRVTFWEVRKRLRMYKLAKEYVVDFNIRNACARAGLQFRLCRHMPRIPEFIEIVTELIEQMDPEVVMTRQELLNALKREAFTAFDAADRIRALKTLGTFLGYDLKKDDPASSGPPQIHLTINS